MLANLNQIINHPFIIHHVVGEENHAEEFGRRGFRGGGGGGAGVADDKAHDRGRLRRQRHPSAERDEQDPGEGDRVLQEARRGRESRRQTLRGRSQSLGRRFRQGRPGHALRSYPGLFPFRLSTVIASNLINHSFLGFVVF